MNVISVIGTRPEIIKMSPIFRMERHTVVHTNQHYSHEMDRIFFDDLELPQPDYNLNVGSGTHAYQTGAIMVGLEKIFIENKPDVVLAQGDTNSVLATALTAAKMHINFGHVEAGLRSYDRSMPEEINRVLADHSGTHLFAPTSESKRNLLKEGISEERIFVTGNTIVDAVFQNIYIADKKSNIHETLSLEKNDYILMTMHRPENVDRPARLKSILSGLEAVRNKLGLPIVFPIHPRTAKMCKEFGYDSLLSGWKVIQPVGYLDFLKLQQDAKLVVTDSGGLQEESCIMKVPCVTLRDSTERPETLEAGSNMLAGADPEKILECSALMIEKKRNWENPFGDGNAAGRIWKIIKSI
ncbi:MAG TPA: UDP-N-acetylglucosamine 2-epimerase (non-hydrolyzing) [archaeon]|nr:UDP-N-acetylglucosamine 2-epimerase (non-hydrolyzing) [archaeon]